jgi:ketosteroid isomerase-like protein
MSQENVELVREGYDRWKRAREIDFELIHPEVEWGFVDMTGKPFTFHGHAGVREWERTLREAWEDVWWEPHRLIDIGDRVVALVTAHVRGQSSGIELEVPLGNIWTVRDGQCVRFELFLNPDEALEAAGLSE